MIPVCKASVRISTSGQTVVGHLRTRSAHPPFPNPGLMKNDQILSLISEFCRQADMAESTFGRRAVNDGKLVHR